MVNDKYVVKYLDPRTGKYEYATIKDVGDLQKLNTKVKTSIVDAINSISTDDIEGLRNGLDAIGETIKSLEDGTLELGDFQSIDDVVSREIEDAINSLKLENSGLLQLTQEEINKIVSNAESEYRDNIATSIRELETSKTDLVAAREKMITIGKMLENANIDYSNLTQVVDNINLYITDIIEKTDFDMVNGIVSDYKTAVTQTQDGWGVDASKNMLSYLTGRVKSNETSLNVQHGLIEAKVGKDEFQYMTVDNLPAGKENMLHNTFDLRDWGFSSAFIFKSADDYRFTSIVQADSAGENITGTTDELEQGVTYAISTYVNVQNKNKEPGQEKYAPTDGLYTATVIIDGDTIELNNVVEDNSALDGWKRVSGTFIAKRTAKQDIKFYVTAFNRDTQVGYLSAPKFEKGSSATSWVPHIEDNVSTMLSQNAVMRVLSDRITSSVEEVRETKDAFETATSTFDQMADGFELNTNKLTEVLDKYGEVTGVQTQQASELKVLNESITSKVWKQDINTTIDTINIDTSNRIVNSAFNIYSYDEQTGALKLDYWDSNTGFAIKKHSQSLDNYLYATRSNATSVNPISIKSSPFALRDGEKILFNFEYLAVGNPLDNDNVFTLEMYDNNDVRVGLQEFRLSELKKEFLTAYDVGDSYKYNGTYIVKNSSVVKGTITLKLPKNGELWLTKVMLQNAGIGTIGWTPSSIDNQIIQSKLSTEINQLADSIELVATDERLDAINGLLVKKDGKIVISPEAIISRVTSQELGEKGLITQTSLKQTEDNLRFDLVDKDGVIQTINASAEGLLIDFDKVQIDGELIARMISAQSIDVTQGFRLTDNNGNTLLGVVNDNGTPTLSIAKDFNVKFKDFSNKLDVTVVNVVDEYYHSTEESRPVGGQWTSAPNDFRGDTFVWKRTKVVLQSGKEYYLPDENGINITSGWNYAKGEVTNAIESAIEEAEQATQAAQDADARAGTAIEKAGANANLLTTHQNTLNTINNTTIPNINKAAADAMAEAKSALTSAGAAMSEAQSALSSASSAMDEAKKADGKIADYVTKNGLVNGTTVDNKIDTATGEISRKITTVESKIPTEIGGRNLILKSNNILLSQSDNGNGNLTTPKDGLFSITPKNYGNVYSFSGFVPSEKLVKGETYTLSFDVATHKTVGVYWRAVSDGSEPGSGGYIPNTNGKIIRYTFTYVQQRDDFKTGFLGGFSGLNAGEEFIFGKFKLERGEIPTDWTPAPEDNLSQSEFQIFESTYDEDVKGINSTLTDLSTKKLDGTTYTNFYNNEYKQTAQGVTDTWNAVNKIVDENGNTTDTFAKAVYDRNAERQKEAFQLVTDDLVTTAIYEDGIDGVKESITSVRGDLDNLKIGGRNYLTGTSNQWTFQQGSLWWTNLYRRLTLSDIDGKVGDSFTASVNLKPLGDQSVAIRINIYDPTQTLGYTSTVGNTIDVGTTGVSTATIQIDENVTGIEISVSGQRAGSARTTFEYKELQLEKGTIRSDWVQAPEEKLGQADFTIFKNTYESNDETIKSRLTAIDSGKEGSVLYNTNLALSTAQGNTREITSVKGKLDNLGSPNLLKNSWHNDTDNPYVMNTNFLIKSWDLDKKLEVGKTYTFRLFGYTNREQFRLAVANGHTALTGSMSNSTDNVIRRETTYNGFNGRYVWEETFTLTQEQANNMTSNNVRLYNFPQSSTNNGEVYWATLVEGKAGINWSPAVSDNLGKSEFTIFKNDYDETAERIENRLTAIDSSAEGSVVTRLNATIKTAGENKNTLTKVNNIITIQDTRSDNQLPKWYRANYPNTSVQEFKDVSAIRDSNIPSTSGYGVLTTTIGWGDKSGTTVQQVFTQNDKRYIRRGWSDDSGWLSWTKMTDQEDIKNFVDSTSTEYQTVIERSNLYERVIGSSSEAGVKSNISRIVQTSGVIQSEITSNNTGDNLVFNGNFNQSTMYWSGVGTVNNQDPRVAGYYSNTTQRDAYGTYDIEVNAKETLYISGIAWTANSTIQFKLGLRFFDSKKQPIAWTSGITFDPVSSPTKKNGTITVPSNASYARVWVNQNGFSDFSPWWFTEVYISRSANFGDTNSKITQMAESIDLKVTDSDLISRINVRAGGVLIQSGTNKLNITPTTTYIQNATIKSAMIDTISASKIKTGTLDADLITSGIASKTGNRVTITNTGMKVSDATFETEFINGGPGFFTKNSSGRTFIGEIGDMTNALNASKALGIKGAYGIPVILGVQMSKTDTTYASKLMVYDRGVTVFDNLQVGGHIIFTNGRERTLKDVDGVDKIMFQGTSYITSTTIMGANGSTMPDTSGWINLQAQWGVNFWYQNQKKARQYGNKFQFWCNVEPQSGFSVSGSSDARLKHNIADVRESSLEKLEKVQFKNFTWNSNNKDDFGFIAQEVINIIPEIIEESEDGYYRYNSTRFNMIVAHATKELNDKVKFLENKIERLERIIDGN